jgi:hypothetical protein
MVPLLILRLSLNNQIKSFEHEHGSRLTAQADSILTTMTHLPWHSITHTLTQVFLILIPLPAVK